ncbi:MAG: isopentenyl-diphosphate Delta-isomerase [Pseudomonadota bacterium]
MDSPFDQPEADSTEETETSASSVSAVEPIMIPGIAADGSFYKIEKMAAHEKPTLHLAISVFLFSEQGELLIQQRAHDKYHCGGMWANTCCTHPHWGEEPKASAHRRMAEEIGVTADITEQRVIEYAADVGNGLWEHERVHMFRGVVNKDTLSFGLNPEEVAAVRWIAPMDLRAEIKEKPADFTPWFRIYAERFPELDF